jgi:hypothetical protein
MPRRTAVLAIALPLGVLPVADLTTHHGSRLAGGASDAPG